MLSQLSRTQIFVYAALAVALLAVGARAIESETGASGFAAAASGGTTSGGSADGGGFRLADGGGTDVVVDVTGAVRRPASIGCRSAPASPTPSGGRAAQPPARPWKRSTWQRGSPTASRSSCRSSARAGRRP